MNLMSPRKPPPASLCSLLSLRMAAGAVRDGHSMAPYYLQDKDLTFQAGGMDGVSGSTQPLLASSHS